MQVGRNEWHTRVYMWWYNHKYDVRSWDAPKTKSNLCPYMRAVMFWAPLRALFSGWVTLFTIRGFNVKLNMIVIPFLMYSLPQPLGYLSYKLKLVAWFLTIVATIVAVGITIIYHIVTFIANQVEKRKKKLTYDEQVQRLHQRQEALDRWSDRLEVFRRFFSLIGALLRTGHDRICPEVQIVEETPKS